MLYYITCYDKLNFTYPLHTAAICCIISYMREDIKKHIKSLRLEGLPEDLRRELKKARERRGWSQRELGSRLGLPQMHISGIESGKIVPRYDTLLELVRILDHDLLMVPRALVPVVQSLIRDHKRRDEQGESEERALYADTGEEEKPHEDHGDEV
jgi:HTH-type transcriptional regulator / antitoxin HipB